MEGKGLGSNELRAQIFSVERKARKVLRLLGVGRVSVLKSAELTLVMHITARQRELAANMEAGQTIKEAMMNAGYTESTSSHGLANVANRVVKLLAKKGIRLRELGRIDAQAQEELVRGRLVYNTLKGSDKGILSAKALGSDKRVNMFVADQQVGVVVLNAPQALIDNKAALLGETKEDPSK